MRFISLLIALLASQVVIAINLGNVETIDSHDAFVDLMEQDGAGRSLLSVCKGPKQYHYFEVNIRLVPGNGTDVCNTADQVYLGNALNVLLYRYGVGKAGIDSSASFLAGICTLPSASTRRRRSLATAVSFVWTGGGGCRFCLADNLDKRKLFLRNKNDRLLQIGGIIDENWFQDVFKPETEAMLENAILQEIVPDDKAKSCLGISPTIDVTLDEVTRQELNLGCDDGKVIESLKSLSLPDVSIVTRPCNTCTSLDFSTKGDGSVLAKGEYVRDEWKTSNGVTIMSSGGYSPEFKARIFDTGDMACITADGSMDFGSPNKDCAGGGIGVGRGGSSGAGENCRPLGNVLIVQKSNKECPDANPSGGILTFIWDEPVLVSDIGLMDIDETDQRLKFTYADGFVEVFTYQGFGDNAVQRVIANKINVVKLEVLFPGSAAVTEINFCPTCVVEDKHDEFHNCLFIENGPLITPEEVLYFEDFETSRSIALKDWNDGKVEDTETASFTKFLGRFAEGMSPYKTFSVPRDAYGIVIALDFYEIDAWDSSTDSVEIFVDGERINLGSFASEMDEGHRDGTTPLGIVWTCDSVGQPEHLGFDGRYKDQKHHITLAIPLASALYDDGSLRLGLTAKLSSGDISQHSAGWDNIQVSTIAGCEKQQVSRSSLNPDASLEQAPSVSLADLTSEATYLGFRNAAQISVGNDGTVAASNIIHGLWSSRLGFGWTHISCPFTANDSSARQTISLGANNVAYVSQGSSWKVLGTESFLAALDSQSSSQVTPEGFPTIMVPSHGIGEVAIVGSALMSDLFEVAVVTENEFYAILSDDKVYHWIANDWNYASRDNARSIDASSDGTVVIIDKISGGISYKLPSSSSWQSIPSVTGAVDVALVGTGTLYYIKSDGKVYRTTNFGDIGVEVGDDARKVSGGNDGTVVIVRPDGTLAQKRHDDSSKDWHQILGVVNVDEIAVLNSTISFVTNNEMKLYKISTITT